MTDKQNNFAVIALAVVAGLAIIASLVMGLQKLKVEEYAGAYTPPSGNTIDLMDELSTTTKTTMPVLALARNTSRLYAAFVNDSDTVMYLYFATTTFSNPSAASTTVGINKGIRLNANGGSYEILPENLFIGEVWVTSTASGKKLLITSQ